MKPSLAAGLEAILCAAVAAPAACFDLDPRTPVEHVRAEGAALASDALAARGDAYFLATKDASPGDRGAGYTLAPLSARSRARHADALDFAPIASDAKTLRVVDGAGPGELILLGGFAPHAAGTETERFVVKAAFRGMPGIQAAPDDGFFVVDADHLAVRLDQTAEQPIDAVWVAGASAPYVDQTWLADRVLHHGAVVTAHLGTRSLEASQVFLRFPDRGGLCLLQHFVCRAPLTPTYTRDVNRCLVFRACVQHADCLPEQPVRCEDGYQLVRWPAASATCSDFACDPAFLTE